MYRDRTKVEHETDISCGHWNSDIVFTEKFGKYSILSIQPTVPLGTSHIIRKVLQSET